MSVLSMPAVSTLQPPRPYRTFTATVNGITGIARLWHEGDVARCRLCERCSARDDACLTLTTKSVPPHLAPTFGLVDHDTGHGLVPPVRRDHGQDCA